jgi:hypothetical protein
LKEKHVTTTLNHPASGKPSFTLDNARVPNGTVLLFGITYPGMGQTDLDTTRGRQTPKVFTYAMLKAGGLWYVTGTGKVPQAAGWGAVANWLAKDNREVVWVRAATDWADLYPLKADGQAADGEPTLDDPSPVDTSQATG